jgi:hypothetical protein
MYQMTDAAYAEAARYCIRNSHLLVQRGDTAVPTERLGDS